MSDHDLHILVSIVGFLTALAKKDARPKDIKTLDHMDVELRRINGLKQADE